MIRLIAALVLWFVASSQALAAAPTMISWTHNGNVFRGDAVATGVCGYLQTFWTGAAGKPVVTTCTFVSGGLQYKVDGYNGSSYLYTITFSTYCAPNLTAPDTSKPLAQMCPDVNPPPPPLCPVIDAGSMSVTMMHTSGPSLGSAIVGGPYTTPEKATTQVFCPATKCYVKPKGPPTSCGQSGAPDSKGYYAVTCNYDMAQTGGSCTQGGNTPSPEHDSPAGTSSGDGKCPPGTVPAGTSWSGMTSCVGDGKTDPKPPITTTEKPPTTTPNPDGGSTTTSEKSTTNADGSTTTTTTTTVTNPDGSTSTTTTSDTKKPDGTSGEQDKPDSDLCKLNPSLTICKNSQVLGKCGEISCTGDAIQCATLRAAAAMECRQAADVKELTDSDAFKLGTAAAAGNDPQKGSFPSAANAALVSMPAMSTAGWLSGGALPADKSFTVQGKTIVVPLSKALAYLIVLRYALMVVALLVSFRILSGAIIRE